MNREFRSASLVLRAGVLLSAVLLTLGIADSLLDPDPIQGIDPAALRGTIAAAIRFETGALIHLGLVVLLLTPVARIVATAIALARSGEISLVLMCAGVLLLLGLSLAIGLQ